MIAFEAEVHEGDPVPTSLEQHFLIHVAKPEQNVFRGPYVFRVHFASLFDVWPVTCFCLFACLFCLFVFIVINCGRSVL